MTAELERLQDAIPEDAIVFTGDENLAATLKYIYHRNIYMLKSDYEAETLRSYVAEHENVYFLGACNALGASWGIQADKVLDSRVSTIAPEGCFGKYPREKVEYSSVSNLYRLSAGEENIIQAAPYLALTPNSSLEDDGTVVMNGAGICFYGPYFALDAGEYMAAFEFSGENASDGTIGTLEIVVNEETITNIEVQAETGYQEIVFPIATDGDVVQLRFSKTGEEQAVCEEVKLVKYGSLLTSFQ
jgi:hypothetical protein